MHLPVLLTLQPKCHVAIGRRSLILIPDAATLLLVAVPFAGPAQSELNSPKRARSSRISFHPFICTKRRHILDGPLGRRVKKASLVAARFASRGSWTASLTSLTCATACSIRARCQGTRSLRLCSCKGREEAAKLRFQLGRAFGMLKQRREPTTSTPLAPKPTPIRWPNEKSS